MCCCLVMYLAIGRVVMLIDAGVEAKLTFGKRFNMDALNRGVQGDRATARTLEYRATLRLNRISDLGS